jgi:hypothetical protein
MSKISSIYNKIVAPYRKIKLYAIENNLVMIKNK